MHADEIREYLCVYRRLSSARDSSIEILPYILNITHNDLCSIDFERILEKCICCCIFFVIFGERLDKRLLYASPEWFRWLFCTISFCLCGFFNGWFFIRISLETREIPEHDILSCLRNPLTSKFLNQELLLEILILKCIAILSTKKGNRFFPSIESISIEFSILIDLLTELFDNLFETEFILAATRCSGAIVHGNSHEERIITRDSIRIRDTSYGNRLEIIFEFSVVDEEILQDSTSWSSVDRRNRSIEITSTCYHFDSTTDAIFEVMDDLSLSDHAFSSCSIERCFDIVEKVCRDAILELHLEIDLIEKSIHGAYGSIIRLFLILECSITEIFSRGGSSDFRECGIHVLEVLYEFLWWRLFYRTWSSCPDRERNECDQRDGEQEFFHGYNTIGF